MMKRRKQNHGISMTGTGGRQGILQGQCMARQFRKHPRLCDPGHLWPLCFLLQRKSPSFCLKAWLPFSIQTVSSHYRGPRRFWGIFPETCPWSPSTAISQPGLLSSAAISKVATGKLKKWGHCVGRRCRLQWLSLSFLCSWEMWLIWIRKHSINLNVFISEMVIGDECSWIWKGA